jgi:thioesterase domain-containing protein
VVERWSPGRRLLNVYGPTEVSIMSTAAGPLSGSLPPPIGRPVGDRRAYVLDERLRPVPVGVSGELYVAGTGLARGYLNRPAMTAERFVACPFGPPGERMYRTGDRVRWRADGQLEFGGRIDDQIKVRGNRAELGEIEVRLARHAGVRQAAAAVRPAPTGAGVVVGYVVLDKAAGDAVDLTRDIRRSLAETLPDYMVPAAVVALDALPLTRNGKLDRAALPVPEFGSAGNSGRAPGTPLEESLCALFADVLNVERVAVDDGFFDLGGQSLLAAQLISRIRSAYGIDLPLRVMFETPTVDGIARRMERNLHERAFGSLLPLRATGDRRPLFCVHPVLGFGWSYAALLADLPTRVPVYALQTTRVDASDARQTDLEGIAAHYLERIRSVQAAGPYRLLGWSFGGLVAFEMAVQLQQAGETVELLAVLDAVPDASDPIDGTPAGTEEEALRILVREAGLMPDGVSDEELDQGRMRQILRASGGALSVLTDGDLRDIVDVLAAHHQALRDYRPGKLDGGLLLFSAVGEGNMPTADKVERWTGHADSIEIHEIVGGHYDLMTAAPARRIATLLGATLGDG